MERVRFFILGAALFAPAVLQAETPEALFKQGNAAYTSGQFAQAAPHYEAARDQGLNHWVLHYNLGNAYYRLGQNGKAIASYLRAFHLNSSQRDVVDNLNLALTKAGDPLLPSDALSRLFWRLFYILRMNSLALVASVAFIAACLGGLLFFLGRWRPPAALTAYGVIALLVLGVWLAARIMIAEKPEAVVISGTAEVRSGPDLSSPANFTVPEGRRVLILKEQEAVKGWLEIGVPQEGLKGWVPDTSLEKV